MVWHLDVGSSHPGAALIGAALIFTGDVEKDVVPSAAPVRRQALPYPLRPFGEQKKHHIAALAHDVPRLNPPRAMPPPTPPAAG